MKLPVEEGDTVGKHKLLAEYGKSIYSSITAGDPDAIWVTQGWTFGYQHDFWDPESLKAMLSEVPDDKMIIIDLGNDYPKWVWHTEQTWKVQQGFHGKKWIYSYVPNFGGKSSRPVTWTCTPQHRQKRLLQNMRTILSASAAPRKASRTMK